MLRNKMSFQKISRRIKFKNIALVLHEENVEWFYEQEQTVSTWSNLTTFIEEAKNKFIIVFSRFKRQYIVNFAKAALSG